MNSNSPSITDGVREQSTNGAHSDDHGPLGKLYWLPHLVLGFALLVAAIGSFVRYHRSARRKRLKRQLVLAIAVRQQRMEEKRRSQWQSGDQQAHLAFMNRATIVNDVLRQAGIGARLTHWDYVPVDVTQVLRQYLAQRVTRRYADTAVYEVVDGCLQPVRVIKGAHDGTLADDIPLVEDQPDHTAFSGRPALSQSRSLLRLSEATSPPHSDHTKMVFGLDRLTHFHSTNL